MEELKKTLSSYVTTFVLLTLFASGLAVATWVEHIWGTALAKALIYYSPLFFFIQVLLVANFVSVVVFRGWWRLKKWGFLVFHAAFIVILSGALISHFSGTEGVLHLREGEMSNRMTIRTSRGETAHIMPFEVELVKFTIERYAGSTSPSSYESRLRIHADGTTHEALVYMNNVFELKGYRFFQASFDADEKGTVLSVNKDVAGRNVTYTGYALLFVGGILCFTGRNGRIRTLYRLLRTPATFVVALAFGTFVGTQAQSVPLSADALCGKIDAAHAERFGTLAVQAINGRIVPVNTFSSEALRKLYKKPRIGKADSDRFLLSVFATPEMWANIPVIAFSNDEIATKFGLSRRHCAYAELFDADGSYKLQEKLDAAYRKMPTDRNTFDKDLVKLDEQVNIIHQLMNHQLIRIFPKADDALQRWYAPGDDLTGYSGMDSLFVSRIFAGYMAEAAAADGSTAASTSA